jgi:hypothetical protein
VDGTWIWPAEEGAPEGAPLGLRVEGSSRYLVVFLEPRLTLALTSEEGLGSSFEALGRRYEALGDAVPFDWMAGADGRLVGLRNLLPSPRLRQAYRSEAWPYATLEAAPPDRRVADQVEAGGGYLVPQGGSELRLWFGPRRDFDPQTTFHRCVFAEPYASPEGRMALVYDLYDLQEPEIAGLQQADADWIRLGTPPEA